MNTKNRTSMHRALMTVLVPVALGTACFVGGNNPDGGNNDAGSNPDGPVVLPFQADSPFVYIAKVKNVLTGLAPSQVEVDSVVNAGDDVAKQAALVTLIDTWMTYPEYTAKMLTFFELSFQQTQISSDVDFIGVVPNGNGGIGRSPLVSLLIQNARESFSRTMLELISTGHPLSEAFTTTQFMMTPALAELYAFMDWNQVSDTATINDKFATLMKNVGITVEDTTPITYADTLDSSKPATYMHWYFPGLNSVQPPGPGNPAGCQADSRSWISTNQNNTPSAHLVHYLLYGGFEQYKLNQGPPPNNNCNAYQSNNANAILTQSDFSTWKMVNVRPPVGSEGVTPFWDVNALRNANELVLNVPRVGFFSTPAFHANWQTNTSNQMRVTVNQAFIVALGAQVDGTDITLPTDMPQTLPGLDTVHTNAGGACVGCHQFLDPSRTILQANYSDGYGTQAKPPPNKGMFIFNGQVSVVNNLTDFGNQLAKHPYFPDAWVQKMCFFVNSQACDTTDPEYSRIRKDFSDKDGGFKWKTLVEDLLSSPITTNAVSTITAQKEGELVSVDRRDHLCTLLNSRLGLVDSCGLDIVTTKSLIGIPEIAAGLPSDGYGRGAPIPVLPTEPTLFYRAGLENICEDVANIVIDNIKPPAGATVYSSTNEAAAIADFVANIMAIVPDDPRSSVMTQKLTDHYNSAITNKATKTDALKSTFVVACLSPNVAGIGM